MPDTAGGSRANRSREYSGVTASPVVPSPWSARRVSCRTAHRPLVISALGLWLHGALQQGSGGWQSLFCGRGVTGVHFLPPNLPTLVTTHARLPAGFEVMSPYSQLLVSGRKTIETRQFALPTQYKGVAITLLESQPGSNPTSGLGLTAVGEGSLTTDWKLVKSSSMNSTAPTAVPGSPPAISHH
jgi:hypothetical protein